MLRRLCRPLGAAAMVCLLAVACTGEDDAAPQAEPSSAPAMDPADFDGTWRLTSGSVDGQELATDAQTPVVLEIAAPQVTGRFPCNDFDLTLENEEGDLSFGPGSSTARTCPPAVEDLDWTVLDALVVVHQGSSSSDRLTLEGTDVTLEFEAAGQS